MKKTKDLFLSTSIICIFSALLNVFYTIEYIAEKNIFGIVCYVVLTLGCVFCSIVFISLKNKQSLFVFKHIQHIKYFCIVTIFCSLLGGIVAFYSYYLLLQQAGNQSYNSETAFANNEVEVINDKNMAKYIDNINRLENMKNSGILSQDKYETLKKQILSNYLNKGE